MQRRLFVNGICMAFLGFLGLNRASAAPASEESGGLHASPKHTKRASAGSQLADAGTAGFEARALMVFMLGATQNCGDKKCTVSYIADLFPPQGQKANLEHNNFTRLGLESEFLKNFVDFVKLKGISEDEVRTKLQPVSDLFAQLFSYSKPDCPTTGTLQRIVAAAKARK